MTTSEEDRDTEEYFWAAARMVEIALVKVRDDHGFDDKQVFEWVNANMDEFFKIVGSLAAQIREIGIKRGVLTLGADGTQP